MKGTLKKYSIFWVLLRKIHKKLRVLICKTRSRPSACLVRLPAQLVNPTTEKLPLKPKNEKLPKRHKKSWKRSRLFNNKS